MNKHTGSGTTTRPPRAAGAQRAANTERTQEFFRGLVSEMRRVTWPTRQEWIAATILTIVLVVGAAAYTWALDQGFGWLFGLVHR